MNDLIAYCGLDCGKCQAREATLNDDEKLRGQVAALWSELNGVQITPEMINCMGCRAEGPKTPYCEKMCPIRICASERRFETCGECSELDKCEKVAAITRSSAQALSNLHKIAGLDNQDGGEKT